MIRDIGNTGAFLSEIVNMGNRKYSFAYVVYILPDQKNEVIRDLSKRTVYSFEKWKIWEKENEIKRRKEGVSLADTLLKLKSTSNEILEKYKYHTTENNDRVNELSESELNHFKYGSSFCFLTEPGIFEDCKGLKEQVDGYKLLELNYNPTTLGKLDLYKIKFIKNISRL